MRNINAILIFLFIPFFYIFSSNLEKNLQFAGDNRPELEKVLKYYGQSPANELKLKAAQFLIENMDAHTFYRSKSLNNYYASLDSISSLNHISEPISNKQDSLFKALKEPNTENLEEVSDLKVVSADFLIDNIDRAFEAWKLPWNKELSFENFCDYLLPYRVSDEYPAAWRKIYKDSMMPYVEHILDPNSYNKDIKTNLTFEKSLKDVSGMKQKVEMNGNVIFSKGVKGSALILDGKENYLTLSYHDSVVPTNMTITAWIFQNEARIWARVFDFGKNTDSYMILTTSPYNGLLHFATKLPGEAEQSFDGAPLPVGKWVHLAVTIFGQNVTIYMNGIKTGSRNFSASPLTPDLLKNIYIGKSNFGSDPLLNGKIDEFRIYNRALSASEIQSIAENGTVEYRTFIQLQELAWTISLRYYVNISYNTVYYGGYKPDLLIKTKKGSCYDYSILGAFYYRSLGIPATIDIIPQWANRSMNHSWNVLFKGSKAYDYSFSGRGDSLDGDLKRRRENEEQIAPKVFREMYSKQQTSLGMNKGDEEIPMSLENSCCKDVTDTYLKTSDPVILVNKTTSAERKFAYLCCFDDHDWIPVHWGRIDRLQAVPSVKFTKMGRGALYLPAIYKYGRTFSVAPPFVLTDSGTIITINPDLSHLQTVQLTRKYVDRKNVCGFGKLMLNGKFQVANKADFSDSVTVHTITTAPEIRYNKVSLSLDKPYRYFRFYSAQGTNGANIAELEVFGDAPSKKLAGKSIGMTSHCPLNCSIDAAFDNDVLSYYEYNDWEPGWVGLDFGKPVKLTTFRFLPRNDGNFIRENEVYELFYWKDRWVSLGVKTGDTEQMLQYSNAPTNALFLLHDKTKGNEERIFTYENGKQIWW